MTTSAGTRDVSAMQKMHGLRTNVLGFPALFAQSVALISPTMTAVLIIPLAFASAGEGTWLAYAFGTVMLLFVVFCLNQFAKRSSFAGSMYAYTAKGLGPSAGVFSGWTLIWAYYFIAVAGLCGFAVFCAQLLSALGYNGSVHPIIFFAISAAACWLVAYKDIRVSSILTLVFEGASVACITALAFVILFKHGFKVDTQPTQAERRRRAGHGPGRCRLHLLAGRVRECHDPRRRGEEPTPQRSAGGDRQPHHHGLVHGVHGLRGGGRDQQPRQRLDERPARSTWRSSTACSFFKIPICIGAMVSFFSLSLSCLNGGSRIMYPMARHGIFSGHLGRAHATNRTPHVAVTVYIAMIFALPAFLMIFTNPLTAFGDAGTLAAFGFLVAYYLITVAAPAYLRKLGELRPRNVVLASIAVLCLLVPTIGSFYPMPAWPVNLFPYIYLGYMAIGGSWLFIVNRRRPGILADIEADLERAPELIAEEGVEIGEIAPQPAMA